MSPRECNPHSPRAVNAVAPSRVPVTRAALVPVVLRIDHTYRNLRLIFDENIFVGVWCHISCMFSPDTRSSVRRSRWRSRQTRRCLSAIRSKSTEEVPVKSLQAGSQASKEASDVLQRHHVQKTTRHGELILCFSATILRGCRETAKERDAGVSHITLLDVSQWTSLQRSQDVKRSRAAQQSPSCWCTKLGVNAPVPKVSRAVQQRLRDLESVRRNRGSLLCFWYRRRSGAYSSSSDDDNTPEGDKMEKTEMYQYTCR